MRPYICDEAVCETDCINRLGLLYLSGGKSMYKSGILLCTSYPDTSVPVIALKLSLKISTVTCLALNFALNPSNLLVLTSECSKL